MLRASKDIRYNLFPYKHVIIILKNCYKVAIFFLPREQALMLTTASRFVATTPENPAWQLASYSPIWIGVKIKAVARGPGVLKNSSPPPP